MWEIITYSNNGKVIEKFDSTKKAFAEWNTYNPWTNHLKKDLIRKDERYGFKIGE